MRELKCWLLRLLASSITKTPPPDPPSQEHLPDEESWRQWLRQEGIGPLLHCLNLPLPDSLRSAPTTMAKEAARVEALNQLVLSDLAQLFSERGQKGLLVKGASLGKTVYPQSFARTRTDTDLWCPPGESAPCKALLGEQGWVRVMELAAPLAKPQAMFHLRDRFGVLHQLDLHEQIFARPKLANMLPFDALYDRSQTIPGLPGSLRMPCPFDHTQLVALHAGLHHPNELRLIWLADLILLKEQLLPSEWQQLNTVLSSHSLAPVCGEVLAWLAYANGETDTPPPGKASRRLHRLLGDLAEMRFGHKAGYLLQQIFPSPTYMRARYGPASAIRLPLLYLHRLLQAPRYLFRPTGHRRR
jgi:hypothetical protein